MVSSKVDDDDDSNDPACELVSKLANPVLKPDNLVLKPEIHIGSILV